MTSAVLFAAEVAFWFWVLWTWTYIIWQYRGSDKTNKVWNLLMETRPLFYVALVIKAVVKNTIIYLIEGGPYSHAMAPIIYACDVWWYHHVKNLDDDRWHRRRKKAAAKVQEIAGRLVVVPEPAPVSVKRS